MPEKTKTTDEYLSNMNEIFDAMEGKQEEESLTDRISKYDLRIEEYLYFVSYALYIVGSSTALKINRQHIDESFIDFYLKRENSYKKREGFSSNLIFGSILPIFEGAVFIDIEKAKEWERNNELDIQKGGMPSGNGYAQEYYDKNKIIEYRHENLLKTFSDGTIYGSLRKDTIIPLTALQQEKKKALEQACKIEREEKRKEKKECVDPKTKNTTIRLDEKDKVNDLQDKPKYTLDELDSFFKRNLLDFANKIKQKEESFASELKCILELIQEEIEIFADYLIDKVKVNDYTSLTAKEKTILSLFRLYKNGFRGLQVSSIARAMAIEYGNSDKTYRKIINELINNGFGAQEPENIKSMIRCIQQSTSKVQQDKGDEMYIEIKDFDLLLLRKLLEK